MASCGTVDVVTADNGGTVEGDPLVTLVTIGAIAVLAFLVIEGS